MITRNLSTTPAPGEPTVEVMPRRQGLGWLWPWGQALDDARRACQACGDNPCEDHKAPMLWLVDPDGGVEMQMVSTRCTHHGPWCEGVARASRPSEE